MMGRFAWISGYLVCLFILIVVTRIRDEISQSYKTSLIILFAILCFKLVGMTLKDVPTYVIISIYMDHAALMGR
jgi:hypothetical protein